MRIKLFLLFLLPLLLLASLTARPVRAGFHLVDPHQPTVTAVTFRNAAQEDDSAAETSDAGAGLIVGLGGATLVIALTAVGIFLNKRTKNEPRS